MKNQIEKNCSYATTEEALNALRAILVSSEPLPRSDFWGGADVSIRFQPRPGDTESSFYPPPRMVYTVHARRLSWLFESLRDAFAVDELLDGCNKIEFYGRLANTANGKLRTTPDVSARDLCGAVFDEAVTMYGEMKRNEFPYLLIAFGGEIADDRRDRS